MECLIKICGSIVGKVAELTVEPVGRQIGYFFNYKSNTDNLQVQIQELKYAKDKIEHYVDAARRNGEEIEGDVQNWLSKAEAISGEAEKLVPSREAESNTTCSNWPLLMRYKISKGAKKKAQAITEILNGGKFDKVSYRLPPQVSFKLGGYEAFQTRERTVSGLMEALRDNSVGLIRVWGMGGVGKTMLVKEVARRAKSESLFSQVVFTTVSQKQDYKAIQTEVADTLGLKFDEDSIAGRARRLRDRLRQEKNVLVILDDVWSELDLEEVGISFSDNDQRRCKIMLTSRYQRVRCINHKFGEKDFNVGVLSQSESKNLFTHIVGGLMEEGEFWDLGIKIVEECAGLPLAISTVAHALKNRTSSFVWKNALKELKRSKPVNIEGMDEKVYSSIKLSYDFLESEEAKSLLLLCCLYEEDKDIALDELHSYGWGLRLFNDVVKLEEARNRVVHLVENLKTCSLLLDGRESNCVKMHDVIRDVCISIASEYAYMYNIRNVKELNKIGLENSTAIFLYCGADDGQLPNELLCPKLKLYSLSTPSLSIKSLSLTFPPSLKIPNLFFKEMKALQGLCLKRVHLKPSSLRCLQNLNTLLLPGCRLEEDISVIGELKNLEILDLSGSDIEILPKQLGQLTSLKSLSLHDCEELEVIEDGVMSSFSLLEELSWCDSLFRWEAGKEIAFLNELEGLTNLTMLRLRIKDPEVLPNNLFTKELERYEVHVGHPECDEFNALDQCYSRLLHLHKISKSAIEQSGLKFLIKTAELLELASLDSVSDVVHELSEDGFPQLKVLVFKEDSTVRYLCDGCSTTTSAFQSLRELRLFGLSNLEKICNGREISTESFKRLTTVIVEDCDRLKNLFHFPTACCELENIEVVNCNVMEEIFTYGGGREDSITNHTAVEMIEFPRLRSIRLIDLPNVTQFCREDKKISTVSPEQLDTDVVSDQLPLFHLQLPGNSTCFGSLTQLVVNGCGSLKYLFSSSVAASLLKLCKLYIENCDMMEAIIRNDQRMEMEQLLPQLSYLLLCGLPCLTSFLRDTSANITNNKKSREMMSQNSRRDNVTSLFNDKDELPNLVTLTVSSCRSLKSVFSASIAKGLLRLKSLYIENCDYLQQVIAKEVVDDQMIYPKFVFPKLTILWLKDLRELVRFYPGPHSFEWPSLETLKVAGCKEFGISQLLAFDEKISSPMLLVEKVEFPNLKYIDLDGLDRLEIWPLGDHEVVENSSCKFESITIKRCINLKVVFSSNAMRRLRSLRVLKIVDCTAVESIFVAETWTPITSLTSYNLPELTQIVAQNPPELTLSLQNLTTLVMESCHSMVSFLTPSTARSMSQLKTMTIKHCKSLTEIIKANDEGSSDTPPEACEIIFPRLEVLALAFLPSLTSFHSGSCVLVFPNLTRAMVHKCFKLQSFSCEAKTPQLKAITFEDAQYLLKWNFDEYLRIATPMEKVWNGDINTTLRQLYNSSHTVVEEENEDRDEVIVEDHDTLV